MLLVFDLYDCIPSLCLNDSECDWPPIQDALRCKLELPYIGAEIPAGVFVVVAAVVGVDVVEVVVGEVVAAALETPLPFSFSFLILLSA